MIRAMDDYGWLHYVQEEKDKAQRVLFIEKIFEDGNIFFTNVECWFFNDRVFLFSYARQRHGPEEAAYVLRGNQGPHRLGLGRQ